MRATITGPLKVSAKNPRYFQTPEGSGVLLAGYHTWNNLVEMRSSEGSQPFDYGWYLDNLAELNNNFIRMWAWDCICTWEPTDRALNFPWARTGPGLAVDGHPKFDLETFDENYFRRLEDRVSQANELGIYVGVMLFESWAAKITNTTPADWQVFAGPNNVNGVDVLQPENEGWLDAWVAMADPKAFDLQKKYVTKVVETLNRYPNVLYEISNEAGPHSFDWQIALTQHIRQLEANMPQKHLVGITGGMGTMVPSFFDLPGDYLAPEGWMPDDRDAPYRKVDIQWGTPPERATVPIVLDTDHIWGIGGNVRWVWKSFLMGYHPLYMDRMSDKPWHIYRVEGITTMSDPEIRIALGKAVTIAESMDLLDCRPAPERSSSGYCLAGPGQVAALSFDGQPLELTLEPGTYRGYWTPTVADRRQEVTATVGPNGTVELENPVASDAVLVLKRV